MLSFSGTQFDDSVGSSKFTVAKSIFTDFFRGGEAKEIDVEGLQMMISFAAGEEDGEEGKREMVYMRCWKLVTKRSGQRLPRVEIEEMGPRIDFKLGRVKEADESMMKEALKRAKGTEVSHFDPIRFLGRRPSTDLRACNSGETKEEHRDRYCWR